MEDKKLFPYQFLPLMGLFAAVCSLFLSTIFRDLRYAGCGIVLFGLLYLGTFSLWFFIKRFIVSGILFSILAIFVISWGLAIFLYHYDIDYLLNLFEEFARFIEEKV